MGQFVFMVSMKFVALTFSNFVVVLADSKPSFLSCTKNVSTLFQNQEAQVGPIVNSYRMRIINTHNRSVKGVLLCSSLTNDQHSCS